MPSCKSPLQLLVQAPVRQVSKGSEASAGQRKQETVLSLGSFSIQGVSGFCRVVPMQAGLIIDMLDEILEPKP